MNSFLNTAQKAIPVYLLVLLLFVPHSFAGGRIVSFGNNTEVPSLTNKVNAISAGYMHSLALTENNGVIAWGDNSRDQLAVPSQALAGIYQISAGGYHNLAINNEGDLMAWGDNSSGQTAFPSSAKKGIREVSAGFMHSLALSTKGKVYAWGDPSFGQIYVPSALDRVVAISAGAYHSMALRNDGLLVIWGDNSFGQGITPSVPHSNIVAISAGYFHNLALTAEGEVIAWGDNSSGQCTIPAEARHGVVAIAAGQNHSLALKADGALISWGGDAGRTRFNNANTLPNLITIAAGGYHSLGIVAESTDTNGNNIPDWWEVQNNLDPAAAIDPDFDSDRDGFTDHAEYMTGSDPWDPLSYFRVNLVPNATNGSMELVFSPVSVERAYTLEFASDISRDRWRPVSNKTGIRLSSNDQPGRLAIEDSKDVQIYRVRVVMP